MSEIDKPFRIDIEQRTDLDYPWSAVVHYADLGGPKKYFYAMSPVALLLKITEWCENYKYPDAVRFPHALDRSTSEPGGGG